jgi:hypothetical protein
VQIGADYSLLECDAMYPSSATQKMDTTGSSETVINLYETSRKMLMLTILRARKAVPWMVRITALMVYMPRSRSVKVKVKFSPLQALEALRVV